MSERYLHWSFLIVLALSFPAVKAAHLVGGEITYKCLGNNDYEITMIIYRDGMSNGAPFDPQAVITIYNDNNQIVTNRKVPLLSVSTLPVTAPNNCTSLPNNIATERGVYKETVNLPPRPGGYVITHQRCCRNNTITNINNSASQWGSTYTTSIPSMDNCNSSPKFVGDPPVVLCVNQFVNLDLSAQDIDGDSLHYELCDALHGGANMQGSIMPDPAAPPPYSPVLFINGFTTQNPIASNPGFSIDPQTGVLSGKPTQVGQFVFAICVSEYKNGVKLSTTRRDFQFNVSNACKIIRSRIEAPDGSILAEDDPAEAEQNPVSPCSGRNIDFVTRSQHASTYFWNFGDPTTHSDTSQMANPSYTFPDTGSYLVMHVADPYTSCADTSFTLYKIFDSTTVNYSYTGDQCFDSNSFDFKASGNFSQQADFKWDFGGATNHGGNTSTLKEPQDVSWAQPGKYYVRLTINDFNCIDVYGDSIEVFPNPEIGELVEPASTCGSYRVQFVDQTEAYGRVQHFWFFGDGKMSYEPNPVHTYNKPGIYTVQHMIKTFEGCLDSGYSHYENIIQVFPVPESKLELSSDHQSAFDPNFNIKNASTGHTNTLTILPDGTRIENMEEENITIDDTGNFKITHISFNEYGCSDTLIDTLRVEAPFQIFMPNAFTPNDDGINDLFRFTITGARAMVLEIYNRWGEVVFRTTDMSATWNGHLQNSGPELPPGVYSFVLIADVKRGGYEHIEKGSINLIR